LERTVAVYFFSRPFYWSTGALQEGKATAPLKAASLLLKDLFFMLSIRTRFPFIKV